MTAIWLPLVVISGLFQILRNGAQRSLRGDAGPWGATLVRFAFGLPFTLVFLAGAYLLFPPVELGFSARFWMAACAGAVAQVLATAALLEAMRTSSFGLGSTFQHLSLPVAALFGAVVLGDHLGLAGWLGIGVATAGLFVVSVPSGGLSASLADRRGALKAVGFGLLAGPCFAVSANCYRLCGLELDPGSPFFASTLTLLIVQAIQTVGLGSILAVADPRAIRALTQDLKASSLAGFAGAAASLGWFAALALAPAALARAVVAVVEAPAATAYGWVRFKERPTWRRSLGSALIVAGVVLTVAASL
jgi:drug/metabolite transporter (DMT)-like permease